VDFAPLIPALVTALLGLVAGGVLAWSLRREDDDTSPAALRASKEAIVELIRDLDADRAKLGEEAWAAERDVLVAEAAAVLAALDKVDKHAPSPRGSLVPPLAFAALVGAFSVWALVAWPDGSEGTAMAMAAPATPTPGMGMPPHGGDGAGLPDDIAALNTMTWAALLSEDLPTAMRANEKARQVAPEDAGAMTHRQILRMSVGMHDKARAGLDEVLAAHPDYPRALLWAGLVRLEMNQPEEGRAFLERVVEEAPAGSDEHESAAEVLAELGGPASISD